MSPALPYLPQPSPPPRDDKTTGPRQNAGIAILNSKPVNLGLFRLLRARHYVIAAQDRLRQAPAQRTGWESMGRKVVGPLALPRWGVQQALPRWGVQSGVHASSNPTMGFA